MWLEAGSVKMAWSRPAHPRVTQTVGRNGRKSSMTEEKDVIGKTLSLILVSEDEGTTVVTGMIQHDGRQLVFQHGSQGLTFPLPDDTLQRIQVVSDEVRTILNDANYALVLPVSNLPDNASLEGMIPTGLKWPQKEEGNGE